MKDVVGCDVLVLKSLCKKKIISANVAFKGVRFPGDVIL